MKNCVHCGAHMPDDKDWCFECDMPQECQHERIFIVYRNYPGTYYEPPETEIFYCECKECGKAIDWGDQHKNADVEEIEYRDYY